MNVAEKELCSGCGACINICPKACISLQYKASGELSPYIDKSLCVDCGLCLRGCPHTAKKELQRPTACYAAYRKNMGKRMDSASGGVGAVLYETFHKVFGEKAVSYGVVWDAETERITYKRALTVHETEAFKGSKYVQPDIGKLHKEVEADLRQGLYVFIAGLPCHIDGCKEYLRIKNVGTDNFYCVDLLCHGVSSQKYFEEEIKWIRKKKRLLAIENVAFRSNRKNLNYHMFFSGKKTEGTHVLYDRYAAEDPYFCSFLDGISLCESCYHCRFACDERCGDLTIGDFIGIGKQKASTEYHGETHNTSMVLINTEKGQAFFEQSKDALVIFDRPYDEAIQGGASLQNPFPRHEARDAFLKEYTSVGFIKAMYRAHGKSLCKNRVKQFVKRMLIKAGINVEWLKKLIGKGL